MTPTRLAAALLALHFATPTLAAAQSDSEPSPAFLALQRKAMVYRAEAPDGHAVELIDLNPSIGRWHLLKTFGPDGRARWAHLDLGQEGAAKATLTRDGNLRIDRPSGPSSVCRLDTPAARAAVSKNHADPFSSLCGGALFARSKPPRGYKSNLESVTDWLRDQGSVGEQLITWRKDLFPSSGDQAESSSAAAPANSRGGPAAAPLAPGAPARLSTANLGLRVGYSSIATGSWAPVQGAPGVWASMGAPAFTPPVQKGPSATSALAYFMAIDMGAIDPRYSVGVDHPALGWSTRAPGPRPGAGPDGFSSVDPIDRVGIVPPWAMGQLAAVISGGFKREHSAFKGGALSARNNGTHYGFAEAGVVFSKLQPGLATFFQRAGEPARIKTWGPDDEERGTDQLLFARQNGLLLIENGHPTKHLGIAYGTNWSGNQDGDAETMRGAMCLAERDGRQFLIYGVFSKALPRDVAQLMAAYQCGDAMQLDMNAPALTYAAVVGKDEKGAQRAMPLMSSMDDKSLGGMGRFTAIPDTRDFIYFVRR